MNTLTVWVCQKCGALTSALAIIQIVAAVLIFTSCTPDKPIVLTPQPTHSPSSTATVIFHVR